MIKTIIIATFFAILGVVYFQYQKSKNLKEALISIFLIFITISFSLFSVYIYVYKPIFIFHVIFTVFSWIEVFRYIFGKKIRVWILLSPAFTIGLFFLIGYFFSEIEP